VSGTVGTAGMAFVVALLRRKVGMATVTVSAFLLGQAPTHSRQPVQDASVTLVRVFTGIATGHAWLQRSQARQAEASRSTAIGLSFPANDCTAPSGQA